MNKLKDLAVSHIMELHKQANYEAMPGVYAAYATLFNEYGTAAQMLTRVARNHCPSLPSTQPIGIAATATRAVDSNTPLMPLNVFCSPAFKVNSLPAEDRVVESLKAFGDQIDRRFKIAITRMHPDIVEPFDTESWVPRGLGITGALYISPVIVGAPSDMELPDPAWGTPHFFEHEGESHFRFTLSLKFALALANEKIFN